MALRKNAQEELDKADKLLMIPDYFHYLLTGKPVQEYTNATTTQLVDPVTKDWNWELIRRLDYPEHIFQRIELPGHEIGTLRKVIREEVGFDCKVILPATHDTGAAVMAVPTVSEHPLYISSGTWSLMGTELTEADCSRNSCQKLLSKSWRSQKRMSFWITRLVCKLWIRVPSCFASQIAAHTKSDTLSAVEYTQEAFCDPLPTLLPFEVVSENVLQTVFDSNRSLLSKHVFSHLIPYCSPSFITHTHCVVNYIMPLLLYQLKINTNP